MPSRPCCSKSGKVLATTKLTVRNRDTGHLKGMEHQGIYSVCLFNREGMRQVMGLVWGRSPNWPHVVPAAWSSTQRQSAAMRMSSPPQSDGRVAVQWTFILDAQEITTSKIWKSIMAKITENIIWCHVSSMTAAPLVTFQKVCRLIYVIIIDIPKVFK